MSLLTSSLRIDNDLLDGSLQSIDWDCSGITMLLWFAGYPNEVGSLINPFSMAWGYLLRSSCMSLGSDAASDRYFSEKN